MKKTNLSISDAELFERYHSGDRAALGDLLKRYEKYLFSIIIQKLPTKEEARDIVQDTYIKAQLSIDAGAYKEIGNFKYWLLRIAQNLVMDKYRRKKRSPDVLPIPNNDEGEKIYESWIDSLQVNMPSTKDTLIASEERSARKKWLREVIHTLPSELKTVLLLRCRFDMSFKEIAEITGMNINTALSRMRYARGHFLKKKKTAIAA